MQKKQYTFLLPAYKVNFFEETLVSIKGQSFNNFKVIVSDDCSPEDLRSVYDRVVGDDSRFKYRRNEVNMGSRSLVSHWNLLVDICDTDFFIMAGDDDIFDLQFLEEINNLVVKYPDVDLFRSRLGKINENGEHIASEFISSEFLSWENFLCRFYDVDFISCVPNYCFKTKLIKKNGGFIDFPLAWFADDATIFASSQNGCCTTQKVLFYFRSSKENISSRWGNSNDCQLKMKATLEFYSWMKAFLGNITDSVKLEKINKGYKTKVYTNILNYIVHCDFLSFSAYLIKCPNDVGLNKVRLFFHYLNHKLLQQ